MIKNKNARVAIWSMLSRSSRIILAPITFLIISARLTSEEIAFYYTFFTLISIQQLSELGIGYVLKQKISESYDTENGEMTYNSKVEINEMFKFSTLWYLMMSVFILVVVGVSGFLYLDDADTTIEWEYQWLMMVLVSSLVPILSPFKVLLDGTQNQEKLMRSDLVSGFIGSTSTIVLIHFNFGLYSIPISTLLSFLVLSLFVIIYAMPTYKSISNVCNSFSFTSVFLKVSPLLKNVVVVFGMSFIFWNSFNLIAFRALESTYAGLIIFSITLAKVGYEIATSPTQAQMTVFSNMIKHGKLLEAKIQFKKYANLSMIIACVGYTSFFIAWAIFPDLNVFNKLPTKYVTLEVFVFFIIVIFRTIYSNFIRCYGVEPFVNVTIFESILTAISFFCSLVFIPKNPLILCIAIVVISTIWTISIGNKVENEYFKKDKS